MREAAETGGCSYGSPSHLPNTTAGKGEAEQVVVVRPSVHVLQPQSVRKACHLRGLGHGAGAC